MLNTPTLWGGGRACEDIAKGKEVLNCYGPHVAHIPSRDERQKALRHQYFFTCRCDACARCRGFPQLNA